MNNIPQNLTLTEVERWAYIENIQPLMGVLDYHWNQVFTKGFTLGVELQKQHQLREAYSSTETWK